MLSTFTSSLKHFLYSGASNLPSGSKIGILTFDRSIHFYNLHSSLETAHMMIVGDLEDVFCPLQEGLLVDPQICRSNIERLLDSLPTYFANNRSSDSCLGSACKSAQEALV